MPAIEHYNERLQRTLGDLASMDHQMRIDIVNSTLTKQKQMQTESKSMEDVYSTSVRALQGKIARQQELLTYRGTKAQLQELAHKYFNADETPVSSPIDHLAHRLAQFGELGIVSDFDNTMSWTPDNDERVYLIPNMPASIHLEEYLERNGREHFARGFVECTQETLRTHPVLFYEAGKHAITFRDGVISFFQDLARQGHKRTILSANFQPFIEGALSKTPLHHDTGLQIHAITHDDISSTDKATALQLIAAANPNCAQIFIGDGKSDMKAAEAYKKGAIAGIFALRGSGFDEELTRQHIPHLTYNDFNDIHRQLNQAKEKSLAFRQKVA